MVHEISPASPGSRIIFHAANEDEKRYVGFVIGSDVAGIEFGDLLEMSNTNTGLVFNRPGAWLAGSYSTADLIEFVNDAGTRGHSVSPYHKVTLPRPQAFLWKWKAGGEVEPPADRVIIELEEKQRVEASGIVRPEGWIAETTRGIVQSRGPQVWLELGAQVFIEKRRGTKILRRGKPTLISIRQRYVIAYK